MAGYARNVRGKGFAFVTFRGEGGIIRAWRLPAAGGRAPCPCLVEGADERVSIRRSTLVDPDRYHAGREFLLRLVAMRVQMVRRITGRGTGTGTGTGTK
jgi:hypothetical protein